MKKVGIYCKIIVIISAILVLFILIKRNDVRNEEFEIFQIYTIKGGDYRRTQINVIVFITEYDIDEMCEKAKNEHERINEKSDELLIRLYDSRKGLKKHKCVGEREYNNNKKTMIINFFQRK